MCIVIMTRNKCCIISPPVLLTCLMKLVFVMYFVFGVLLFVCFELSALQSSLVSLLFCCLHLSDAQFPCYLDNLLKHWMLFKRGLLSGSAYSVVCFVRECGDFVGKSIEELCLLCSNSDCLLMRNFQFVLINLHWYKLPCMVRIVVL